MQFPKWFLFLALAVGEATGFFHGNASPPELSRRTAVVDVAARSRPAVVRLKVAKADGYGASWEATGTGVVVDERGDLVTARHTVAGACGIRVVLADGAEYPGRVVAADPATDLAILRFHPRGPLQPLALGQGHDLLVGETVVALGHPYGYAYTVSTGIISAVGREIALPTGESLPDLIQVDAHVNPGNSGGPLLNIRGDWIGLLIAVRDGAQGIAFAVNADTIRAMLRRHLGPDFGADPGERTAPEGSP